MAAKFSRHIALTEPLAQWAEQMIAKGEYASISDLVRTALRQLQDHHRSKDAHGPSMTVTPVSRRQNA